MGNPTCTRRDSHDTAAFRHGTCFSRHSARDPQTGELDRIGCNPHELGHRKTWVSHCQGFYTSDSEILKITGSPGRGAATGPSPVGGCRGWAGHRCAARLPGARHRREDSGQRGLGPRRSRGRGSAPAAVGATVASRRAPQRVPRAPRLVTLTMAIDGPPAAARDSSPGATSPHRRAARLAVIVSRGGLLVPPPRLMAPLHERPGGPAFKVSRSVEIADPYPGNVSLIGDAIKLVRLENYRHKGLFVIGFEHSPGKISLDPLINSFEVIARQVMNIDLGERIEERRDGLVHPEYQVLRCIGWELMSSCSPRRHAAGTQ